MKSFRVNTLLPLIFVLSIFPLNSFAIDLTLNNVPAKVFFSPNGGCTKAIVEEINKANSEILIQAYSFTSASIAKALVEKHKDGIRIEVILDKSQRKEKYTNATFLSNNGIATFIDDNHAIAHNKVMIIDKKTVITGSFNFTKTAEVNNAENLLIIKSKNLSDIYIENWNLHKRHSEKYIRDTSLQ